MSDRLENYTFRSTAIASATYDPETSELNIEFTGGGSYSYSGVPPELWGEFKRAESPGRFYDSRIKGVY